MTKGDDEAMESLATPLPQIGKQSAARKQERKPEPAIREVETVRRTISAPMLKGLNIAIQRNLDIRGLPAEVAMAVTELMLGLQERDAKLKSGFPISCHTRAVMWLLEQLADDNVGKTEFPNRNR